MTEFNAYVRWLDRKSGRKVIEVPQSVAEQLEVGSKVFVKNEN